MDEGMRCRCNQCMREFMEGEQYEMFSEMERSCRRCCHHTDGCCALGYDDDPDGCEEYDPTDTCPWCGSIGCIQWVDYEE